jgi:hypothetical protein
MIGDRADTLVALLIGWLAGWPVRSKGDIHAKLGESNYKEFD